MNISSKRLQLDRARNNEMRTRMEEYDRDVYYPAKRALYAECQALGHGAMMFHDNGLGWTSEICRACGAIVRQHGPDNEVEEKDYSTADAGFKEKGTE